MKCEATVDDGGDEPCGNTANWSVRAPDCPALHACPGHLIDAIDEAMTTQGVTVKEIIT